jgi:hypothetical protein
MSEKKFLDQVRETTRRRNYAYRTKQAYVAWINRYIIFHNLQHPDELGEREIECGILGIANNFAKAAVQ